MKNDKAECGVPDTCERIVPLWLVLLDNVPTMVMFGMGALLAWLVWRPLGILMLLYNFSSIVMFWGFICRHCRHFGTRACPCGYGVLASRYFRRREEGDFRKIFRKNISLMYPCWFIPLAAGVFLLYTRFSRSLLILFAAFVIVGFILIPAISRFVGCKGCTLKDQCPWMN
jgi:hypothetical protein